MYEHVLIPTDGSQQALVAARYGATIAERVGATVHVLSIVDTGAYSEQLADVDPDVRAQEEHLEARAKEAVRAVDEQLSDEYDLPVTTTVDHGVPYEAINDFAAANDIDLVTMGTHGRSGVDRLLLGSVAERVIRTSEVPVLAVSRTAAEHDRIDLEAILIPTDGSAAAEAAAEHGLRLAKHHSASVDVLNVIRSGGDLPGVDDPTRQAAEDAVDRVAQMAEEIDIPVRTHVQTGRPTKSILRFIDTNGIDLVAMGTGDRSRVTRHLLGSVAETVVRESESPVLTTREAVPSPDATIDDTTDE